MHDVVDKALSDPIIPTIGLGIGATIAVLWLVAAWWAYRDATHRAGSYFVGFLAAAWIVVSSPFLLPFSLAVYTLTRPQQSAAQTRSRRLIEELTQQLQAAESYGCPTCTSEVDPTWLRCPTCATWLAQPCSACGGWSDPGLDICPWCGSEERVDPVVQTLEPAGADTSAHGDLPARPGRRGRGLDDLRGPRRRLVAVMEGHASTPARAQ